MKEPRDDNQLPPVSGPEEGPSLSSAVPQVEGYDITEPLGQGGMGTVWSAVQLSTHRRVALKLLGRGAFASQKSLARFEREVELTARLQHPNIARIYDSGLHQGVRYYAMELIEGMPLDKYVQDHHLTQRQFLELMRTVCLAIQHAHERGVIHRDLKPSNIFVTPDGQPHILDFGLAKGLLEEDSGLRVSTDGEAAGTPPYMSPQQAAGHLDQVNTRTDVYSLGVVLFRLLTGGSPHDLSGTRYEVLRRIAEEEVKRPREITTDVDRELEALLLKALAHDPKDRYPSPGALAQDIENYLSGEPLTARPPTTAYFLRKRIRKYRVPAAIACAVLAVLVGVGVSAYVRVVRERTKAVAAEKLARERLAETKEAQDNARKEADKGKEVYDFLQGILAAVDPAKAQGRQITLCESLDEAAKNVGTKFTDHPEVEATVRMTIADIYFGLGRYGDAQTQHSRALEIRRRVLGEERPDTLMAMHDLARTLRTRGKLDEAEAMVKHCLEIRQRILGKEHPDTLELMNDLALILESKGKLDEAEAMHRRTLESRQRVQGEEHSDTLGSMHNLARILCTRGKLDEAEGMDRRTLEIRQRTLGKEHPDTLMSMHSLAVTLAKKGKYDEAEAMNRQILEIRQRVLGKEHPDTLLSTHELAWTLYGKGKYDQAEAMNRQNLEIRQRVLGDEQSDTLCSMNNLALALERKGKLDEAEAMNRRTLETRQRVLGDEQSDTLCSMNNLACILSTRGKFDEAEAMLKQCLDIKRRVLGEEHPDTLRVMHTLAQTLERRGKRDEAEAMHRRNLEIRQRVLGEEHPDTLESAHELGWVLYSKRKYDEAEAMHRRNLEIRQRVLGKEHPDTLMSLSALGRALLDGGKDGWEPMLRSCLEMRRRVLGEGHPHTLASIKTLADALSRTGRFEEEESLRKERLEIQRRVLGEEHPDTLASMQTLAETLSRRDRLNEAEAILKQWLEARQRVLGEEHADTLSTMNALAIVLLRRGKLDEAEALNRRNLEIRRRIVGEEHPDTLWAMSNLAVVLEERGSLEEAEALRREGLAIRHRVLGKKHAGTEAASAPLTVPAKSTPTLAAPVVGSAAKTEVEGGVVGPGRADVNLLAYDAFDGKLSLDWKVLNPDPSHFSLTKKPGTLTITTQKGAFAKADTDYKNLFLINCPTATGDDFQLTTCISSFKPVADWNQAGLICYDDDDNYVKFVYEWNSRGGGRMFTVGIETEGRFPCVRFRADQEFDTVWLRITKRGNRYAFWTSLDGKTFLPADLMWDDTGLFQGGAVWGDGAVTQVGLFAKNGSGSAAPEIDASFDFFEVRAVLGNAERAEERVSAHEEEINVETRK